MKKLPLSFYRRDDLLQVSRDLMGKLLVTKNKGIISSGRIVELEAYAGVIDRASHAWSGRRTPRNEMMYMPGGLAYVYICYGIHHLFNVVTNVKDNPHAILIRALEPVDGIKSMLRRTKKKIKDNTLTRGPGNLTMALGIDIGWNGLSLQDNKVFIADDEFRYHNKEIFTSPRIGVEGAGKDAALLPYRFYIKGNPYVSGRPS
ncbi:MAG TPA: DNA-3-methyladenine glycosylase [Chitinophagaceae bacterium]|nr:DNA-3-methyladenine glycosylase [Chitinophagaceae bacterium]